MMFNTTPPLEYLDVNGTRSESRRRIDAQKLLLDQPEYSWQQGLAKYKRSHVSGIHFNTPPSNAELIQQNLAGRLPAELAQEIAGKLDQEETHSVLTQLLTSVIISLQNKDINEIAEGFSACMRTIQEDDNLAWYTPRGNENPDIERAFRAAMGVVSASTNDYSQIYTDEEIATF